MVDEINAALADEIDSFVTDGLQSFQILFPHYRLLSNSFVRQDGQSRRKTVESGVPGFAHLFADFWKSLMEGREAEFLEGVIKHSTSIGKAGLILPFIPRFLKR
jgi:hypothetical protein